MPSLRAKSDTVLDTAPERLKDNGQEPTESPRSPETVTVRARRTPAAHTSRRAALRPKSSLAVAHSGEIVHTARIDVLVKPQVVALHTRGLIFHSYLLAELAELGARRARPRQKSRGG